MLAYLHRNGSFPIMLPYELWSGKARLAPHLRHGLPRRVLAKRAYGVVGPGEWCSILRDSRLDLHAKHRRKRRGERRGIDQQRLADLAGIGPEGAAHDPPAK